VGERGGGESGPAAASWAGRGGGPREEVGLRGPKGERGKRVGWFCFFFFFKSISNQNFKPFLNQIFYMFSNSNSNTNFSNYFKGFSQTIFNNFSNIF
jgi:hypothetical protein